MYADPKPCNWWGYLHTGILYFIMFLSHKLKLNNILTCQELFKSQDEGTKQELELFKVKIVIVMHDTLCSYYRHYVTITLVLMVDES